MRVTLVCTIHYDSIIFPSSQNWDFVDMAVNDL